MIPVPSRLPRLVTLLRILVLSFPVHGYVHSGLHTSRSYIFSHSHHGLGSTRYVYLYLTFFTFVRLVHGSTPPRLRFRFQFYTVYWIFGFVLVPCVRSPVVPLDTFPGFSSRLRLHLTTFTLPDFVRYIVSSFTLTYHHTFVRLVVMDTHSFTTTLPPHSSVQIRSFTFVPTYVLTRLRWVTPRILHFRCRFLARFTFGSLPMPFTTLHLLDYAPTTFLFPTTPLTFVYVWVLGLFTYRFTTFTFTFTLRWVPTTLFLLNFDFVRLICC